MQKRLLAEKKNFVPNWAWIGNQVFKETLVCKTNAWTKKRVKKEGKFRVFSFQGQEYAND